MNKILRNSFVALMAMFMGNAFAEETVDFSAKGYANASEVTEVKGTDVTLTFADNGGTTPKWYNSGSAIRMYAKNSLTIVATKDIKLIKFSLTSDGLINDNNKSFSTGEYDAESTKWTGSATNLVITNAAASGNQIRIQKMTFYFEGDNIPGDVHIANTAETAYTVAEAIKLIDAGEALSETVFVKGIVSQVDSYNSTYKSITYWISDDGKTDVQLECYSGKGIDGADFAAVEDVEVGANVVVKGTITKYKDIYEFSQNNQLVSYTVPANTDGSAVYTWDAGTETGGTVVEKNAGETSVIGVTKRNYTTIQLSGKNDFSTSYLELTLDQELKAGDKILVTGFRDKADADVKRSGIIFKFANDATLNSDTMGDDYFFNNLNEGGADYNASKTEPNTLEFTVPEGADGKTLLFARGRTQTNMWVTKLVITRDQTATAITEAVTPRTANGAAYSLSGQKVGKDYKGIVIVNGKKFVQK